MTLFFTSQQIQIYRKRRIGSSNRYSMSATLTAYPADVQPASKERIEMVQGRFGATFSAFVDQSVDIKEGDQVVNTSTNKRYSVKGVNDWYGAGMLDHKELVLVALDA